MGTSEFNVGVTLRSTSIPSRGEGSRNSPGRFMLQKSVISNGLMGRLASMQTLPEGCTYLFALNISIVEDYSSWHVCIRAK